MTYKVYPTPSSIGAVAKDGTVALTADWDAGSFEIRAQTLEADVATGTAPLTVASTTKVANLNADLLDDQTGSYYLDSANFTGTNWTDLTDGGATTLHTHAASGGLSVTNQTGTYSANASDFVRASGTFTITLPTTPSANSVVAVKNVGAGLVTVARGGSDTIFTTASAQTSFTVLPGEAYLMVYYSTGTEWEVY